MIPRNQIRQAVKPVGRYDNPIPTLFLAFIDCLIIKTQFALKSAKACSLIAVQLAQSSVGARGTVGAAIKKRGLGLVSGTLAPTLTLLTAFRFGTPLR